MGYKLTFAYDNRGNLTDVIDRDNGTTHYAYDDDSRMTSVTNPFDETTGYVYSPGGRVDKRLLANGCVTYYGYDQVGQVSLVDNRAPDLSVISTFAYERDARGNPTRITREDGSVVEYGYDARSQLTSEVHKNSLGGTTDAWEWNYDLSGNRLYQIHNDVQTDYTYNLANQLTEETTGTETTYYRYDRCGNTVKKQALEGTTSYHWDPENRLTQIDQPGNMHSYFTYDADGKRVTKEDGEGFTRFIYQGPDMLKLLQERDEEDNVIAHYTIGDGLESMRRSVDSRFYHYDWLGSTFELTDGNGAVTDSYLYDAWGNALATSGATPNPHRYVGRERYYEMPGTGLYHLGHRELTAAAGRFLTVDPVRDGRNWYLYVNNGTTRSTDAQGLWGPDVHFVCTLTWGLRVRADGPLAGLTTPSYGRKLLGRKLADTMAQADNGVDFGAQTNPVVPWGWPWHFDWPPGTRSRQRLFNEQWELALRTAAHGGADDEHCQDAVRILGMGLHAIQDSYAHLGGPHEHMDIANDPYMDNTAYDATTYTRRGFILDINNKFIKGRPGLQQFVRDSFSRSIGHDRLSQTRVWKWTRRGPSGSWGTGERFHGTRDETVGHIVAFLQQTRCGLPADAKIREMI